MIAFSGEIDGSGNEGGSHWRFTYLPAAGPQDNSESGVICMRGILNPENQISYPIIFSNPYNSNFGFVPATFQY
jgi:hypothetical protein